MKFTKEILHQLLDPNVSPDEKARLRCQLAKQYEESGNYEAAREAMGELWRAVGERPSLEGLDEKTKGEVLLRAGAITGWLGSTKQIQGSQETAKNLITESIAVFEALREVKLVAEAQTEIAVCYRREGALDEARVMLLEALSRLDEKDGDLTGLALLRSALVAKLGNRLSDALNILTKAAPLFHASTNDTLKGKFHNEFGNVLRRLADIEDSTDYIDRSLIEYEAASYHFGEAGHTRYQACVENNLGLLYLKINRLSDAHERLDRAQALFTRLTDNVHLAQVEDTRARLLLSEGALVRAEKIAKSAVGMLEQGGEQSILAEALTTHGIALTRLGDIDRALKAFERAMEVAERAGDLESAGVAALTLFEHLAEQLSDDEIYQVLERAYSLLKDTRNTALRNRLTACLYRALSMVHTFRPHWETFSLEQTLHRHEARYIQMALEDAGGNKSQAARLLGLSAHQNLQYMLKSPHKNLRNMGLISGPESSATEQMTQDVEAASGNKTETVTLLHVEDDPTLAALVSEIAEHESWQLKHVTDGEAGLRELASDTPYDVLLVDFELPGLDGLELVKHTRSMVHRRNMPIVMLSGNLDETTANEAGANVFLRKPQDIGALVGTINRLLAGS